jgi:hypothetical protein
MPFNFNCFSYSSACAKIDGMDLSQGVNKPTPILAVLALFPYFCRPLKYILNFTVWTN